MPETPHIELKSPKLSKRVALSAAAISVSLCFAASASAGAASAQDDADAPEYSVTNAFQADGVNEVRVATEEAREAGMGLIADELRDEGNVPEDGTLLVEYYDSASENTGFALVFDNEDAVLDTGTTEQFGEVYDREDAERIIEEEDAMRVVSNEEFAEENASIWDRIKGFFA